MENIQRTAEWFAQRLGNLTGSRAGIAFQTRKVGARKGEPTEAAEKLILELVYERVTRNRIETPETFAMRWGTEHEDEARQAYTDATFNEVCEVGFLAHNEIEHLGASPDGLIEENGERGILEIKCPSELTHMQRVIAGVVPEEYKPQMLVEMLCAGAKWADFVDYDPRNTAKPLFIVRYTPTAEELKEAEEKAVAFLKRVDEAERAFLNSLGDTETEIWSEEIIQ